MESKPKRGRPRAEKPLVTFSISLPPELREAVEKEATREGRSVAGQIRQILQRYYKKP